MKTETEIIIETIEFYLKHPERRGYRDNQGTCFYIDPSKPEQRCAVGRCLADPVDPQVAHVTGDTSVLVDFYGGDAAFDAALKPEYRGHRRRFWNMLQCLHDETYCWPPKVGHAHRRRSFVQELFPDIEGLIPRLEELKLI